MIWDDTFPPIYKTHTVADVKQSILEFVSVPVNPWICGDSVLIFSFNSMQKLAVQMRARRFENGALRLDNTKVVCNIRSVVPLNFDRNCRTLSLESATRTLLYEQFFPIIRFFVLMKRASLR